MLVSVLVTTTNEFVTAAPLLSVTVPKIIPPCWADNVKAAKAQSAIANVILDIETKDPFWKQIVSQGGSYVKSEISDTQLKAHQMNFAANCT